MNADIDRAHEAKRHRKNGTPTPSATRMILMSALRNARRRASSIAVSLSSRIVRGTPSTWISCQSPGGGFHTELTPMISGCIARLACNCATKRPSVGSRRKLREDRRPATRSNETWAMDFVHDQLATGTKLRVLTIVDTFSRFSPAIEPRFTFRGSDVVDVLERVGREIGYPAAIRVDQGTEFVSRDLDLWAYQRGVTLDFSRPGKPTDNAFIESFNGKFRAECLNAHWFMSLDDARRKCEAWRRDYNEERPHSAIGNKVPIELVKRSAALGPP